MHDADSMLADLNEAIGDAPVAITIVHRGGVQSQIPAAGKSDVANSSRVIDDEGIIEQADVTFTFPGSAINRAVDIGERVIHAGTSYRVMRPSYDRMGVSVSLECKELA